MSQTQIQTQNPNADFYIKHRNLINLLLRCLVVFTIPVIAGLIFFKNRDIHPFGDNSLLSVDLWGQYFPMYRQFADSNSFSEAMYSWNGALGFNNFVQSAFYCRSLFLLIFKLVPINSSIAYINYVCILRLGISAVTCLLFLEHKFRKKSPVIMAASICYGLCAYSIAFIMQFMWTDCIMYTPLILLGLDLLIEGKSPLLYVISLTLTIYTNFYVGFGVCLFTLFYFIAETVKTTEFGKGAKLPFAVVNWSTVKKSVTRFAVYSLLSGAMTAVIAIPTLKGLSLSMSANEGKLDFSQWYHTFSENVNAMLPQTGISLEYGVANIATGLFMFILIPLYFFNTKIKFRDKLASGAFLFALYSGLNYNPMDYVFNGFHFPNQLPGRWSFLFSLAVVIVAVNGLAKSKGINLKSIVCSWIVGIFFLLFSKYSTLTPLKEEHFDSWFRWLTIFCILLIVYVVFSSLHESAKAEEAKEIPEVIAEVSDENAEQEEAETAPAPVKKKFPKEKFFRAGTVVTSLAIAAIMTVEVCSNAVDVASEINGGVGTSNMVHYLNATNLFTKYGEMYDCGDDDFYRVENNTGWTFNDGLLGGYKAIGYYGSTLNGRVYNLLRFMGNRVYAQNVSTVYNNSSTVQNSIWGIRYIIDRGRNLDTRLSGITRIADYEDCIIWENTTPLPLAFAVSEKVRSFEITDEIRPITTQNNLVNLMYGEDINVYEKQAPTAFSYENCELAESADWNVNHFYCHDTSQPTKFTYTYTCPSDQPVYIEQNFRAGQMFVTVGENTTQVDVGSETFKYLGSYPAGTQLTITHEVTGVGIGCFGVDLYSFNTEKWQTVYNKLSGSGLDVTSFKNTKVEGTINMAQAGVVFTSIPQDGGWDVYVDGKKVNDFLIGDALTGFMVGQGTHEITFKYSVPAFGFGLVITIISLLLTLLCLWIHRNGGLKKKSPVAAAAAPVQVNNTPVQEAVSQVTNEIESPVSEDSPNDEINKLIQELSSDSNDD